jgi:EmrB/QacA subfamily drug resistance transporter
MTAVGLSIFMATLDVNIVNVSLPTLVTELRTDFATIQWVILGYVLVVTSMTLCMARLGDMRGKRTLFAGGLSLFTLGSLLCGLSPGVYWLIGFRMVQGLGAAITQALGAAIVTESFPTSERGRAMGLIGSTVSVGLAMGPALGGVLIGIFGWRSVFLINIPIGVLAVWATFRFVPPSPGEGKGLGFDFTGAALVLFLMGTYALGMTLGQRLGFGHSGSLGLLSTSALLLLAFVSVERRMTAPMVDLKVFRNLLFSINLLMGWLVFIVVGASFTLPFYLEKVKSFRPEVVGLLMMIIPLSMGLVAPLAGSLSDRFGARGVSLAGLIVCVLGCLSIGGLNRDVGMLGTALRLVPLGAGMGLFQSPNNSAIMGAVPRRRLGLASGLMTLSRTLGHTTGIPLAGAAFTAWVVSAAGVPGLADVAEAPPSALVAGISGVYSTAALIIAAATLLAALALVLDRRRSRRRMNR